MDQIVTLSLVENYIKNVHAHLYESFWIHQEDVFRCDIPEALASLERYHHLIASHQQDEDHLFIPIFKNHFQTKEDLHTLTLLDGEHQKIDPMILRFKEYLIRLQNNLPVNTRDIILLFEHESHFKHLFEHHDERELSSFYPKLKLILTNEEQQALIDQCQFTAS